MARKRTDNLELVSEQEELGVELPLQAPSKPTSLSAIERVERSYEMVQIIRDKHIKEAVLAKPSGSKVWELFLAAVEREIVALQSNEQIPEDVAEITKMLDQMATTITATHQATQQHLLMFTQTVQGALGRAAQSPQAQQRHPQARQQDQHAPNEIPQDVLSSIMMVPTLNL